MSFGLIPEWLVRFRIRWGNTIIIVWRTPSNERPFQIKAGAMTGMRIKLRIKTYGALLDFAAWMIPALAGATPASCEHWNTLSFSMRTGAADLAGRLGRRMRTREM